MGAKKAKAAFTIHWPAHAVAASVHTMSGRTPKFISPSAMAVVVEVNPNAATPGNITFSGQPVIVNNNGTATSTVNIDAPVGSDEFVFTLWDQAQTAGETQPVGNQLGQADVVQTIVANQTNNVNAVIGGITSHINIAPLPNQLLLEADPGIGYDLVGEAPETFVATAQDADGNAIVGPGAPTLAIAATSGAAPYINVQPVSGNPSQFTVAATAPFGVAFLAGSSTSNMPPPLGVVVTATDAGVQHIATGNLSLYQRSAMYVTYAGTAGVGAGIALYDDYGNNIPLPSGAFSGLTSPAGVAYDPVTRQVFVADTGANAIMAFDAFGNPVTGFALSAPGSLSGARGIAYDPKSDTLFATGTSKVIAFKANGSAANVSPTAFSQTSSPDGIAFMGKSKYGSADDEIAVANDATKAIDYYDYAGTWLRSDALKTPTKTPPLPPLAAPIVGLGWNAGIPTPIFAAGGPAGSGFAISEYYGGGFSLDYLSSTTTRYGGVAISQTHIHDGTTAYLPQPYEIYVVMTDANQIQGYVGSSKFTYPDVLITTPTALGLSNPIGIATSAI
jgi:hypothetical protein